MIIKANLNKVQNIIDFVKKNGKKREGGLTDVEGIFVNKGEKIGFTHYHLNYVKMPKFIVQAFRNLATSAGLYEYQYGRTRFSQGQVEASAEVNGTTKRGRVDVRVYHVQGYLEEVSKNDPENLKLD